MPKYVIEREIPGAGRLTPEELKAISQKSCAILQQMVPAAGYPAAPEFCRGAGRPGGSGWKAS